VEALTGTTDMDIGLLLTIGVVCLVLAWLLGKVLNKMAKNTFSKIDGFNGESPAQTKRRIPL
jgi:hypothetical protein